MYFEKILLTKITKVKNNLLEKGWFSFCQKIVEIFLNLKKIQKSEILLKKSLIYRIHISFFSVRT